MNMKLAGDKIILRFFEDADAESLLDLYVRNRAFFQQYSPTFNDDYFTLDTHRTYIVDSARQRGEDKGYSFGIFIKESGVLAGSVTLFHLFRGPLQKCMVGYSLDQQYNGRGYTTEAVSLAVKFAFEELKLHRVEAGVNPGNIGSMRVLEKAGFQKEGIERKGVKINGQWEDHMIFAILAE